MQALFSKLIKICMQEFRKQQVLVSLWNYMQLFGKLLRGCRKISTRLIGFFGGLLFDLGACWDRGLDLDLDQGLTI